MSAHPGWASGVLHGSWRVLVRLGCSTVSASECPDHAQTHLSPDKCPASLKTKSMNLRASSAGVELMLISTGGRQDREKVDGAFFVSSTQGNFLRRRRATTVLFFLRNVPWTCDKRVP